MTRGAAGGLNPGPAIVCLAPEQAHTAPHPAQVCFLELVHKERDRSPRLGFCLMFFFLQLQENAKVLQENAQVFFYPPPPICFSPLCPLRGSVGWWSQSWYISDDSCHSCHAIHHFIYYLCLHRSTERKLWGDLWGWDTRSWQSTQKRVSVTGVFVCWSVLTGEETRREKLNLWFCSFQWDHQSWFFPNVLFFSFLMSWFMLLKAFTQRKPDAWRLYVPVQNIMTSSISSFKSSSSDLLFSTNMIVIELVMDDLLNDVSCELTSVLLFTGHSLPILFFCVHSPVVLLFFRKPWSWGSQMDFSHLSRHECYFLQFVSHVVMCQNLRIRPLVVDFAAMFACFLNCFIG